MSEYFASDRHAFYTGMLMGHLAEQRVEVQPVMVGGDYTPEMIITLPDLPQVVRSAADRGLQVKIRVIWDDDA